MSNLVDNALRHNIADGAVRVTLTTSPARTALTVVNTGPVVAPTKVELLRRPFRRGTPDLADGLGLGLSIVADIATAHGVSGPRSVVAVTSAAAARVGSMPHRCAFR